MKTDGCPLVLIEWEDSRRPDPQWQFLSAFEKQPIVACVSVGWLISDGKKVKVLAPNMGDIEDEEAVQVCGVIRIPARSIKKTIRLKEEF